jgi:hypothetical protein
LVKFVSQVIPGTVKFISRAFFLSGISAEPVNERLRTMYHDTTTAEEKNINNW